MVSFIILIIVGSIPQEIIVKNIAKKLHTPRPKIIAVVGPTASGKSDLAVSIAKKYNGEVISVDSRQVYRGLNIGSGKITKAEMKGVPHHLLDITNPKKVFTASDFVKAGRKALNEILKKGKVPVLAGGTGFYLSALLGEMSLAEVEPNPKLRAELEKFSNEKLLERLSILDPERVNEIDRANSPRIIRAIEIATTLGEIPKQHATPLYQTLKIGVRVTPEVLEERINSRLMSRFKKGMLAEAKELHKKGVTWKRMIALGLEYRYMALYLKGEITKEEMVETLKVRIRQYAKRQRTWLKRDKDIQWFELSEIKKVEKAVEGFLG
ncbi:MAG: tRNA (adenosine(37)-N6)-dimethylallyltransferase MiaA [Candidatus Paceibacterota bacterium]